MTKTPPSDPRSPNANSAPAAEPPRRRRKLSAIMMVDVSGFSRMMGIDEEGTVGLIQDFHRRIKDLTDEFEGRVVDTAGDSALGEFDSVVNAMRCARRIQEEQMRVNAERPVPEQVKTRIGIHLGDVIAEDYNVYGDGVNIAARLEPLAEPGGICFSEAVYQQIRNKIDFPIEEMGLTALKNIEHPIRLYQVRPIAQPAPMLMAATLVPEAEIEAVVQSWFDDVIRAKRLIPLIIGLFLLLSPVVLFRSGGVFPTAGAILLGVTLGHVWSLRTHHAGHAQVGLGLGIAAGAVLTNWSPITNTIFLLAGVIVAAIGVAGKSSKR